MVHLTSYFLVFILFIYNNSAIVHRSSYTNLNHRNSSMSLNKQRTYVIPIIFHLDQPLLRSLMKNSRMTRSQIKKYMQNLLNEVQKNYRHPTLMQKIDFTLINVKFLRNNTRFYKMDDNGSKYLKSYCDWQELMKKNKQKWYYSILVTGLNIYYLNRGKKIWSSTGRSYRNGICNLSKSCTLVEWQPKNIVHMLTHEIGHSLGLKHDGHPHNVCKAQGYIMSFKYNKQKHPQFWSPCTHNALKNFLTSDKAQCLQDRFQYTGSHML